MFNQVAFNQTAYNRPSVGVIIIIFGVSGITARNKLVMYNAASLDASSALDSQVREAVPQVVLWFLGSINPNDVVEIDMQRMTATINGQNALHLVAGKFWELVAGRNTIEYTDNVTSRHVELTITFRDRWL